MAPKSPVLFLLVFYLSLTGKGFGQKQSKAGKKDHYFGAYIGDFQDRFHGIAGQVKLKNKAIRLGTPVEVNKYRLHQRFIDDNQTPPQCSGQSGSAWGWWCHDSAFLEPGQFSEHL